MIEDKYNLKRVGQLEYCNVGDMKIEKEGKMSWAAMSYINNILERIEKLLESMLCNLESPMSDVYYSEIDGTLILETSECSK